MTMAIDIDGVLLSLDNFRADVLAKLEAGDPVTEDDLFHWQPAFLAYTAGAIIATLRAERDDALVNHAALARIVGEALVAATLAPDESLADPSGHAITGLVLRLRAEINELRAALYRAELTP